MAKDLAKKGETEEAQLNCYRKVRDDIKKFVKSLPDGIGLNTPLKK